MTSRPPDSATSGMRSDPTQWLLLAFKNILMLLVAFAGTILLILLDVQIHIPRLGPQFLSRAYPHTMGRVIKSSLIEQRVYQAHHATNQVTGVEILYSYDVGNQSFTGSRLRYGSLFLNARGLQVIG